MILIKSQNIIQDVHQEKLHSIPLSGSLIYDFGDFFSLIYAGHFNYECVQIKIPNFTFVIAQFADNISGA